jgi:hypothetical protein
MQFRELSDSFACVADSGKKYPRCGSAATLEFQEIVSGIAAHVASPKQQLATAHFE